MDIYNVFINGRYAPGAGGARPLYNMIQYFHIKYMHCYPSYMVIWCVIQCIGEPGSGLIQK